MEPPIPTKRFAEIVIERTVERFLLRLFLRDAKLRDLCIVPPLFISSLADCWTLNQSATRGATVMAESEHSAIAGRY